MTRLLPYLRILRIPLLTAGRTSAARRGEASASPPSAARWCAGRWPGSPEQGRPYAALVVALLVIGPVAAQAPVPRSEVKRASAPLTIDGKLDEAAWKAAPTMSLQFLWDSQTGAKQMTRARLLWDAQGLYVGFDADDADITAQFQQHDDPTYRDDAVEIFINPNPQQEVVYYGFEMNARGTLYDYLNYNSRTLFKRFDATGVKIATSLRGSLNVRTDTDNGWSLEALIPWPNFEELSRRPPVVGAVWKVNFNRWDGVEPNRRMSIWSDPQNNESWPHVPARFGEIVFVD